jgi:hypothetical protein
MPRPKVIIEDKVRNYVIGHDEIARDREYVRQHFVDDVKRLTQQQYDFLAKDPVAFAGWPNISASSCGANSGAYATSSLEDVFTAVGEVKRDLEQHFPKLRELAANCTHVTEFTKRRESTIAFAAGVLPKGGKLVSYNTEGKDGAIARVLALYPGEVEIYDGQTSETQTAIAETDMLFIDSQHTFGRLSDELKKFAPSVRRYIVMHDTQLHGFLGEDGGQGLLAAIREFCRANPQWSVVYHTLMQYGLTVLSCSAEDKPKLPPLKEQATNLLSAIGRFVSKPQFVDKATYEERLNVCALCPHRNDARCSVCGCFIEGKAAPKTETCPLGMWEAKP